MEKITKQRLLEMAEFLEKLKPEKFNMLYWITNQNKPVNILDGMVDPIDCGTIGCIAGWATMINNDFKPVITHPNDVYIQAKEWFGFSKLEAQNVFYTGDESVWAYLYHECGVDLEIDYETHDFGASDNKQIASGLRYLAENDIDFDVEYIYNSDEWY